MCDVLVLFYWSNSSLYTREREAKSFVVCWLNVFNAGKQKWSENKPLWLSHSLTRWTLSPRLTSFLLVQAWADAFRSSPDLTGVVQIYEELKRKGIEFPASDLETLSPIHTPQRVGTIVYTRFCPLPGSFFTFTHVFYLFHGASRLHRPQRETPLYINTAAAPLSPHHSLSHQPTPVLRSPTFRVLDPSTLHLNRYSHHNGIVWLSAPVQTEQTKPSKALL